MSGGAFDYAFSRMSNFAYALRVRLEDGDPPWEQAAVVQELRRIADLADHVSKLAREAEWLYRATPGRRRFCGGWGRLSGGGGHE